MSIKDREINVNASRTFANICSIYDLSRKAVCDVGCGFGEYLRSFGKGSIGITTTLDEIDYSRKNSLPVVFGNAERIDEIKFEKQFDVIWANNIFEHLLSPHSFMMKLKKISQQNTVAIIGVPVIPKIVSLMGLRWFRGSLASNHINFFTHLSLRLTLERAGWNIVTVRPFIFKYKFLDLIIRPFAPHLYVVAENNSLFRYPPKKVGEWISDDYYAELLSITRQI